MVGALVAVTGCEHGFTLRGNVLVPAAVQARFSAEAPGLLVMGGGKGSATVGPEVLAVLCAPTGSEPQHTFNVPLFYDRMGCATEGELWFKAVPLGKPEGAPLACGIRQESYAALLNRKQVPRLDGLPTVAGASVTIFKGRTGGACRNGEDTVSVALVPTAPTPMAPVP
jgi:hypothetical protein